MAKESVGRGHKDRFSTGATRDVASCSGDVLLCYEQGYVLESLSIFSGVLYPLRQTVKSRSGPNQARRPSPYHPLLRADRYFRKAVLRIFFYGF